MDYSLLLGVHYRAPHHLRSFLPYRQNVPTDGLAIVAEGEFYLFLLKSDANTRLLLLFAA